MLKNVLEPGHEGYTLDACHVSFCHVPQSNQQLNYIDYKFLCLSVLVKMIIIISRGLTIQLAV